MKEPIIIQILRLIRDEGPLSAKNMIEKLEIKRGTAYPLISILRDLGLIQYLKEIKGVYTITDYGEECPTLKEKETTKK